MGTPVFVSNRLKNGRDVTDAGVGKQFEKNGKDRINRIYKINTVGLLSC
jgi:hypothetical protein